MVQGETFIAPGSGPKWAIGDGSDPEIKSRRTSHLHERISANHGIIEFDIRAVTETEMHVIVNRLKEIMNPEEPKE